MDDSKVSAAPDIVCISGKEFKASPFTDRDLDFLTNYVRYQINKRAREEAEFAENASEASEIIETAFTQAASLIWYEPTSLSILSSPAGTAAVAYMMLKKETPDISKEWLSGQFGSNTTMLPWNIENILAIRVAFSELNSLTTEVVSEEEQKKPKKKKKE